jgi:hypothetical protein
MVSSRCASGHGSAPGGRNVTKRLTGSASIVADLRGTLDRLHREANKASLSARARRALEKQIQEVIAELARFLNDLNPIRQPTAIFDPSNPKIIGRFVSLALVAQSRQPLAEIDKFYGSGVCAIYYNGEFPAYTPLSRSETPIYVGQAAPALSNAPTPTEQGDRLSGRLDEHRKNILLATTTLSIDDFEFRALVVQSGWETAAEDYLIHLFSPIWNFETKLVYGLGKHGDSASIRANRRSPWDTLHPSRHWAASDKLQDAKTPSQIMDELKAHFKRHPVFPDLNSLLASFIEELRQV